MDSLSDNNLLNAFDYFQFANAKRDLTAEEGWFVTGAIALSSTIPSSQTLVPIVHPESHVTR